jgi:hypothetical protein
MNNQDLFSQMQMWGYYLEPKAHAFSPGFTGISVAIRATPTQRHYDAETIELCLLNQGNVERTRLGLQLREQPVRRVCPGRVALHDRFQKRTDFYTYGAELCTLVGKEETIYRFLSNAPILWLVEDDNHFPEQLEAATEAILASIHAKWHRQDALFARRLVEIEPIDLYWATLRSIDERYAQCSALRGCFSTFYDCVRREILWQQAYGNFRPNGPQLEMLLPAPNGMGAVHS